MFRRLSYNHTSGIDETYFERIRSQGENMSGFHDLTMSSISGDTVDFAGYKDTLCLVVNVASR